MASQEQSLHQVCLVSRYICYVFLKHKNTMLYVGGNQLLAKILLNTDLYLKASGEDC